MLRKYFAFLWVLLMLSAHSIFGQGYTPIPAFPSLSFSSPVLLTHSPDGTNRIFVVEQGGLIKVFPNDSAVTSSSVSIFLNVANRLGSSTGEQGLLGMAFHPDYANNGFFYLNYSAGSPRRTVIARFSVTPGQPNKADSLSWMSILEINQDFSNHNGGNILFGPDGYLYIGMGDGGSGNDPNNRAQDSTQLLGKMLRIDVDNTVPPATYSIPSDNPFVAFGPNVRKEIWALGMRNPWRWSFDAVSGELWVGDVGQNNWEEIDLIEGGKNYGWRLMEGFQCNPIYPGCDTTGLTLPIKDYSHSLGFSVTGGYVYRGYRRSELTGAYIYADYGSGRIWKLRYVNGMITEDSLLYDAPYSISSFGEDQDHELYIVRYSGSPSIYRFAGPAIIPNPTTVLMAPNGGEVWEYGTSRNILWYSVNVDTVNLSYRISDSNPWVPIAGGIVASSGTYSWTIPALNTTDARVRIATSDSSVSDISNNVFTLATASIAVSSDSIDFGTVSLQMSGYDTVVVTNTGTAVLNITGAMIDSSGFSVLQPTLSVPPGQSRDLIVLFSPLEERNYAARLRLTSNAPSSPTIIYLSGNGLGGLAVDERGGLPERFGLFQNYPNPFNPATNIQYAVSTTQHVTLRVYDMLGREVATLVNGMQEPGYKTVQFHSSKLSSGVYYYKMTAGAFTETKRMLLVR